MTFEKCPHRTGEWEPIEPNELQRELDTAGLPGQAMLDFMAVRPEVVETNTARYRKYVPAVRIDWAKGIAA